MKPHARTRTFTRPETQRAGRDGDSARAASDAVPRAAPRAAPRDDRPTLFPGRDQPTPAAGASVPPASPAKRSRRGEPGAAAFVPKSPTISLEQLRQAANACRGCDLYRHATQAVIGEGALTAAGGVMMVGEAPGDQEDRQGHPFVGPAGQLLNTALTDAGIDRERVFITNAVKHFKWTPAPKGTRRIHAKPTAAEVYACGPWLEREIALVKPRVLVLLGATAAQALLGSAFRVSKERGIPITTNPLAATIIPTVHPSTILRAPNEDSREAQYAAFVADLRVVAEAIRKRG